MDKDRLPNPKLEFMKQINNEQLVIIETKLAELGQEDILRRWVLVSGRKHNMTMTYMCGDARVLPKYFFEMIRI